MNEEDLTLNRPARTQLIEMLKIMNDDIERMPPHAMLIPITNMDLSALLILLYEIFSAEA